REAWVPVRVAVHEAADARLSRALRERGERRPAFEARAGRIGEYREEVVEVPERVVAPAVCLLPEREHVVPRDVLLAGLDAEAGRVRHERVLYHPRRSINQVSSTRSPSATYARSWYATVGSTCAGRTRTRSPGRSGRVGANVTCSSEKNHA